MRQSKDRKGNSTADNWYDTNRVEVLVFSDIDDLGINEGKEVFSQWKSWVGKEFCMPQPSRPSVKILSKVF